MVVVDLAFLFRSFPSIESLRLSHGTIVLFFVFFEKSSARHRALLDGGERWPPPTFTSFSCGNSLPLYPLLVLEPTFLWRGLIFSACDAMFSLRARDLPIFWSFSLRTSPLNSSLFLVLR